MKLAQSLALIITGSASFVIPFALAQVQISKFVDETGAAGIAACAPNHYGCDCSPIGINAAFIVSNPTTGLVVPSLPEHTFSINFGFCGNGVWYDFYNRSDASGIWDSYVHNGNGSVQGTCHPNTESTPTRCTDGFYVNNTVSDLLDCQIGCRNA